MLEAVSIEEGSAELESSACEKFWQILQELEPHPEVTNPRQSFMRPALNGDYLGAGITEDKLLDALTRQGIPEHVVGLSDLHLASMDRHDQISDGRRLVATLSHIPALEFLSKPLRQLSRRADAMTRVVMHLARQHIQHMYKSQGMLIQFGDTIDAYISASWLSAAAGIERYLHNAWHHAGQKECQGIAVTTGNHDSWYLGAAEVDMNFKPIAKKYGTMDLGQYRLILDAVKQGYSWESISRAWDELQPNKKAAINPALRWYLGRLAFGPQVGRFVDESSQRQVAMVCSAHLSEHGQLRALQDSLCVAGLNNQDPLYLEISEYAQREIAAQEALLKQLVQDAPDKKMVIYTHDSNAMQDHIVGLAQQLRNDCTTPEKARAFVEHAFMIYGGHRHTESDDIEPTDPGRKAVRGETRIFLGWIVQRARRYPGILEELRALRLLPGILPWAEEHDQAEILSGPANEPKTHAIRALDIWTEFTRLIHLAHTLKPDILKAMDNAVHGTPPLSNNQ